MVETQQATDRINQLREQRGIRPEDDAKKKPDAKALKASLPNCSEKRLRDAEKREAEIQERNKIQRAQTLLRESGIPSRHGDRLTLHGEKWLTHMRSILGRAGTGFLVAVVGDRGRGKTQLGVKLIQEYIWNDKGSARYIKAMDVFMSIRQTYNRVSSANEKSVLDDYAKPRLLVIDAMEVRGDTSWEDRLLNHLIDKRYDDCKDTLLIGNIAKDDLEHALGHSILSRINETGGVIVCDWQSYREVNK